MADHDPPNDLGPSTCFLGAERAEPEEIESSIRMLANNPFLDATLEILDGWVAVLNRYRQVLAVNHTLLLTLGVEDPSSSLGLRIGEAVQCAHAHDHVGGCGTGSACVSCGAAIATMVAQQRGAVQERECALVTEIDGARLERVFLVRCCPFQMGAEDLLLISMRDISVERRRVALERAFLHDLNNILTVLVAAAYSLGGDQTPNQQRLLTQLRKATDTLVSEVKVQQLLYENDTEIFQVHADEVRPSHVLSRVETVVATHPAATNQTFLVEWPQTERPFRTDAGLLIRILVNMIVNAFEAGTAGDQVRVGVEDTPENVTFYVWNRAQVPESVRPRIFQRYFTTKTGAGRGVGTFSMKLLGETLLKGDVSFTTSDDSGTTFRIKLPRETFK